MDGPLTSVLELSHATEMLLGVLIGAAFGFVLERGGFGRADRLVAVFYGRDFRVLRVMFTAIATASTGLYLLDATDVLPLASIGVLDTWLLPQLVGGLLLGAGFVLGGYCPGTSIVATMSGKRDGLLFLVGLTVGAAIYSLAYGDLARFAQSTGLGRKLLSDALGLSSGVVVFLVALFAVATFWMVGRLEAALARRRA